MQTTCVRAVSARGFLANPQLGKVFRETIRDMARSWWSRRLLERWQAEADESACHVRACGDRAHPAITVERRVASFAGAWAARRELPVGWRHLAQGLATWTQISDVRAAYSLAKVSRAFARTRRHRRRTASLIHLCRIGCEKAPRCMLHRMSRRRIFRAHACQN